MPHTTEVFGIRVEPVLSYVSRPAVDGAFERAVKTDHHILVYGSSKQGKTALRQKHLKDAPSTIYRCSPKSETEGVYQAILRSAGVRIQVSNTASHESEVGATARAGFTAKLPFFGGASTEVSGTGKRTSANEVESEFIGYDLSDAQAVADLLINAKFNNFVVLENFHYLRPEVQRQLAFDLKTFHEVGIRFVVLGIWRESNFLTTHNGDLQGRVVEVPVEPWARTDFDAIVSNGTTLLNVVIDVAVVDAFWRNSYGNVGLFQEFLKAFCEKCGVEESSKIFQRLENEDARDAAFALGLDSQRATLMNGVRVIAAKSRIRRNEDPLLLPYYLMVVLLCSTVDDLRRGIERSKLHQLIRDVHHRIDKEEIRTADITNLLAKLPDYQRDISPLFYYDQNSKRVQVVDSRALFVLSRLNGREMAEELPRPEADLVEGPQPESD